MFGECFRRFLRSVNVIHLLKAITFSLLGQVSGSSSLLPKLPSEFYHFEKSKIIIKIPVNHINPSLKQKSISNNLMFCFMLTQFSIIIQWCKTFKKPSVSFANCRDRQHKADKSCRRVLAIKKCFATKQWLCKDTELSEINPLCFVYKDNWM